MQAVPGAFGNEAAGGVATLQIEGTLRLPGCVERQIVGPAIERRRLLLQEQIEVVSGELVAQEILHLGRLLDLAPVAVEVDEGLIASSLGTENLAFDLLNLDGQNLSLVRPFVETALPSGFRQIKSGSGAGNIGERVDDPSHSLQAIRRSWSSDGQLRVDERRSTKTGERREKLPALPQTLRRTLRSICWLLAADADYGEVLILDLVVDQSARTGRISWL